MSETNLSKLIRQGKEPEYMSNYILLKMLCVDGYIPAGEYLVRAC